VQVLQGTGADRTCQRKYVIGNDGSKYILWVYVILFLKKTYNQCKLSQFYTTTL
jgi:hypothetical protein